MHHVDHRKALIKLIEQTAHRHSVWQVFADFCEMSAISISNAVDQQHYDEREKRYMEIVKRYSREEIELFPKMLGHLVDALEEHPSDVLGSVFHELELHNTYKGQFFTPYNLCEAMAKMTLAPDEARSIIERRGFVSAAEPACGSGAMVIALAQAMRDADINYQQALHVTATDLDARCVHMAYVQLSLLHIPAIIQHGNTLTMEEFGRWYTPAHILGGWQWRTRRSPTNALLAPVEHGDDTPRTAETSPPRISTLSEQPASHAERIKAEREKPRQLSLF